jgi:predicted acylesterase/phospholipase RssA
MTDTGFIDRQSGEQSIALALSGGGFRATLFHLGVICFLRKSGSLSRVRHICSVSGGSILAAHLVLNWDAYTSDDPRKFERIAGELIRFTKADVRGKIFRYWLLWLITIGWVPFLFRRFIPRSWWDLRTWLLQRYYRKLLGEQTLDQLGQASRSAPTLHILATSMTTGKLCSFTSEGFSADCMEDAERTGGLLSVAQAVAASSAFPPAFPVVTLWRSDSTKMPHNEHLTDGGVYDNLAILQLKRFPDPIKFVSDAGASFYTDPEATYPNVVSRTNRTSGILMTRLARVDVDGFGAEEAGHIVCHIEGAAESSIHRDLAQWLPRFRTDLDGFSNREVRALVLHGYAAAHAAWKKVQANVNYEPWDPLPPGAVASDPLKAEGKATAIVKSFRKSCRLRLWRWFSPGSIPLYLVLLAYFALASVGAWTLCHRPSPGITPAGVEIGTLARALKEQDDPSVTPGKYVMFTGTVNTDNSHFESHPHMKLCKDADNASCCVVVFKEPLTADARLNKTVTVVGKVSEDQFGLFGGQWVIMSEEGLVRVNSQH